MIADAKTTATAPARAGGFAGVELWCVDLAAAAPALARMERRVTRLSPDDVETARAMTDATAAADWLTARAGLRLLLERAAGPDFRGAPFARMPHGKPRLEGAPVAFSLSHVRGLALIGLTRADAIGVDLERTRPVRVALERRGRIEAAGAALNAGAPLPDSGEARFLQAWVRLESFAKADGGGIGRLLARLGLIGGGGGDTSNDAIAARVAMVQAAMAGTTHDLGLEEDLFAAVTIGSGQSAPPVRWLPTDVGGLAALLG